MAHEIFRDLTFPFPDGRFPPEPGDVVRRTVLHGNEPARIVIHDDGGDRPVGDGVTVASGRRSTPPDMIR